MSAREVLAAAYDASLFRPHRTNTQAADDLIDALAEGGYSIVPDGHARIDGQVVRLVHARNHKYDYEGAYIAGTFCGWIDDEADPYGRCADSFYRPLYVAVPLDSEEADDE